MFGGPQDDEINSDSEGAGIKTDPELESILKKADQFREEGNYRIASKYWQTVLEKSGDALYSDDEKVYFSLATRVEQMIAQLPEEGLQMYRITADGQAKEIMAEAQGGDRVPGLSQVVKRFFISSEGDDAAFELAGIYLDRFDFVGAIRLYRKIIDSYPDPSVPMDQVWLRLALSYAYVGNREAAMDALGKARELSANAESPGFARIAAVTERAEAYSPVSAGAAKVWSMRLGNASRNGLMPTFPLDLLEQDLQPVWQFSVSPDKRYDRDSLEGVVQLGSGTERSGDSDEVELVDAWARHGWLPAGELLIGEGTVYFKTQADLTAWDLAADSQDVVWRPLWMNVFDWDGASLVWKQLIQYNRIGKMARDDYPNELDRAFHFGDRIHQSMSLLNGRLYSVEGKEYSDGDRISGLFGRGNYNWGSMPRRTRTNFLTCYDGTTGKFQWRYPPLVLDESNADKDVDPAEESDVDLDIGFMSGPVAYGKLLLAPVNSGGSIWIYALDAESGKRVWRSFLCDEPSTGSKEWAPIYLTLAGSDLYANCGYGAFFVLDPATGGIRFARRYARTGEADSSVRNAGIQGNLMTMSGFDHDMLIPYGNQLILLASDHKMILGFDRQSGALVWEAPTKDIFGTSVSYLIGVHEEILYAGGNDNVIAYDLAGEGRMLWTIDHKLAGKMCGGRAMLTADGVFVPAGQEILRFDLKSGELLQRVGVRLQGKSPVGNLYSDGKKLWLLNGPRLMALGPVVDEAATDAAEQDGQ